MVPRLLNDGQKENRVQVCQDILKQLEITPDLLSRVVTGDESWIFEYDPFIKRQSLEWKSASSPRPKKARLFKSKIKVMLIAFFDVHGIVHLEFLPQGQTINQNVYKDILRRLMRSVREKRRELWETKSWLLYHDNAPAHNALSIRQFLAENNIAVLEQPPYSPDLAPCDFFLFPKLKGVPFSILKSHNNSRNEGTTSDPNGIFPEVHRSMAAEIRKVHLSSRRLL